MSWIVLVPDVPLKVPRRLNTLLSPVPPVLLLENGTPVRALPEVPPFIPATVKTFPETWPFVVTVKLVVPNAVIRFCEPLPRLTVRSAELPVDVPIRTEPAIVVEPVLVIVKSVVVALAVALAVACESSKVAGCIPLGGATRNSVWSAIDKPLLFCASEMARDGALVHP